MDEESSDEILSKSSLQSLDVVAGLSGYVKGTIKVDYINRTLFELRTDENKITDYEKLSDPYVYINKDLAGSFNIPSDLLNICVDEKRCLYYRDENTFLLNGYGDKWILGLNYITTIEDSSYVSATLICDVKDRDEEGFFGCVTRNFVCLFIKQIKLPKYECFDKIMENEPLLRCISSFGNHLTGDELLIGGIHTFLRNIVLNGYTDINPDCYMVKMDCLRENNLEFRFPESDSVDEIFKFVSNGVFASLVECLLSGMRLCIVSYDAKNATKVKTGIERLMSFLNYNNMNDIEQKELEEIGETLSEEIRYKMFLNGSLKCTSISIKTYLNCFGKSNSIKPFEQSFVNYEYNSKYMLYGIDMVEDLYNIPLLPLPMELNRDLCVLNLETDDLITSVGSVTTFSQYKSLNNLEHSHISMIEKEYTPYDLPYPHSYEDSEHIQYSTLILKKAQGKTCIDTTLSLMLSEHRLLKKYMLCEATYLEALLDNIIVSAINDDSDYERENDTKSLKRIIPLEVIVAICLTISRHMRNYTNYIEKNKTASTLTPTFYSGDNVMLSSNEFFSGKSLFKYSKYISTYKHDKITSCFLDTKEGKRLILNSRLYFDGDGSLDPLYLIFIIVHNYINGSDSNTGKLDIQTKEKETSEIERILIDIVEKLNKSR